MQELAYSLHHHIDITIQYRSHTCLPTFMTDIWLLQPVYFYRCLLQAYAPLTMFWCNNANHLSLLGASPSCIILLGKHLLYKDVEYIIV